MTALEDVANHKILHQDYRDLFREYPRFDGRVVTLTSPRSRCEHLCGGRLTSSREVAELFVARLFEDPMKGTRYSASRRFRGVRALREVGFDIANEGNT